MIGEKIVPALRELGTSGTRHQVIDKAIELGGYTEAQRQESSHSKRHPGHTYLEHALGDELSRLKGARVIGGDGKGMWWLN